MTSSGGCHRIPHRSEISPSLSSFLATNIRTRDDLFNAGSLETQLLHQCSDLDRDVVDLHTRLSSLIVAYASHSGRIGDEIGRIRAKLGHVYSLVSISGGPEDCDVDRSQKLLAEELPVLAKEVTRLETVRAYAEIALKLDSLVGDIEDVVSSMKVNLRKPSQASKSEEAWMLAIKSLKNAEGILTSIIKSRPKWTCLVSAVDRRVDRALAILRPQVIADHRMLLVSLGWPPPLIITTKSVNPDHEKGGKLSNPLIAMHGDIKSNYCNNFLALSHLQELQMRRKARMLVGHNREIVLHQPLWTIEELVNPITSASEKHFSKWIDKPEFIFALIYRITKDFVESMDELLQPLVDMVRLKGYSCREEWISAMVTSLVTYLEKEIFPVYLTRLEDNELATQAKVSWLHLIDLMIDFDKRMHSLVASTGLLTSTREDENLRRISSMSVFCDRPDWLETWAEIETKDILDKLMPELENEKSWRTLIQGDMSLSGLENCTPIISASVLRCLTVLVDRCRPLPDTYLCERFIKLTCSHVMLKLANCLHHRCQEAEGLTALVDDDAMIKVANCVNAARYCELVLQGWCEDVFFLEMRSDEDYENAGALSSCIFYDDIEQLKRFRVEWTAKLSTVIQRGFDAQCRDYIKNKRQWQEAKVEISSVSPSFIDALDYLQGKIVKLGGALNEMDFTAVWRSAAGGVDQLLFNGIFMANVKFSDGGVERFRVDLELLLRILQPWCLRPQGFFPRLSEALCVLKLEEIVGRELMGSEENKGRWLKEHSIGHLSVIQAEKLIKFRIYGT